MSSPKPVPGSGQEQQRRWPKRLPELNAEQKHIREEFMTLWHEVLPARYGVIERFNHGYPASRQARSDRSRTLEKGRA